MIKKLYLVNIIIVIIGSIACCAKADDMKWKFRQDGNDNEITIFIEFNKRIKIRQTYKIEKGEVRFSKGAIRKEEMGQRIVCMPYKMNDSNYLLACSDDSFAWKSISEFNDAQDVIEFNKKKPLFQLYYIKIDSIGGKK